MVEPKLLEPQPLNNSTLGNTDTKNDLTHISITHDKEEVEEVNETSCCCFTKKIKKTSKVNSDGNALQAQLI